MGVAVLILGESGSGKSASLRNFKQEDVGILNVASKPLPFRNVNKLQSMNKATYASIKGAVCSGKKLSWVVDDAQYLMAFESFDKVNEVGYGKFTTMAKNYEDMLRVVQEDTSPDTIVYIMQHIFKVLSHRSEFAISDFIHFVKALKCHEILSIIYDPT